MKREINHRLFVLIAHRQLKRNLDEYRVKHNIYYNFSENENVRFMRFYNVFLLGNNFKSMLLFNLLFFFVLPRGYRLLVRTRAKK